MQWVAVLGALLTNIAVLVEQTFIPPGVAKEVATFSMAPLIVVIFFTVFFSLIGRKYRKAVGIIDNEVLMHVSEPLTCSVKEKLKALAADIGTIEKLRDSSLGDKDAAKKRFKALHDAARTLGIVPEDERWNSYFKE